MMIHPKDPSLRFPFVKYELDSPEKMMKDLFFEFFLGNQDYDHKNNILYRPYLESYKRDAISSHFTEDIRVECRSNKKPRYDEVWKKKKRKGKYCLIARVSLLRFR